MHIICIIYDAYTQRNRRFYSWLIKHDQIAFTTFRLIWNQTKLFLVTNQSENGEYNLILVDMQRYLVARIAFYYFRRINPGNMLAEIIPGMRKKSMLGIGHTTNHTQRNIFQILLNQADIRLNLPL